LRGCLKKMTVPVPSHTLTVNEQSNRGKRTPGIAALYIPRRLFRTPASRL
jgi:hypothetical protein